MNKTWVVIGLKQVRLTFNLERLSALLKQAQLGRGIIFDVDTAREAAPLAKQQILAGAAKQTISVTSAQKRGLVHMLILL